MENGGGGPGCGLEGLRHRRGQEGGRHFYSNTGGGRETVGTSLGKETETVWSICAA